MIKIKLASQYIANYKESRWNQSNINPSVHVHCSDVPKDNTLLIGCAGSLKALGNAKCPPYSLRRRANPGPMLSTGQPVTQQTGSSMELTASVGM